MVAALAVAADESSAHSAAKIDPSGYIGRLQISVALDRARSSGLGDINPA
jgi:hypothetical protein